MPRRAANEIPLFRHPRTGRWMLRRTIPTPLRHFFPQSNGRLRAELSPVALGTTDQLHAAQAAAKPWAEHQEMLGYLKRGQIDIVAARAYFREKLEREDVTEALARQRERQVATRRLEEELDRRRLEAEVAGQSESRLQKLMRENALRSTASKLLDVKNGADREITATEEAIKGLRGDDPDPDQNTALAQLLEADVDEYLEHVRQPISPSSPKRQALQLQLREVLREEAGAAWAEIREALTTATSGIEPRRATASNALPSCPNVSLRRYFDEWYLPNRQVKTMRGEPGVMLSTIEKASEGVKHFTNIMGQIPIGSITREHMKEFRNVRLKVPASWTKRKEFKGKPLREVIEAADQHEAKTGEKVPRLDPDTVGSDFSGLRDVFKFAIQVESHLRDDPSAGVQIERVKDKRREPSFSTAALNTLFASPLFAGCAGPDDIRTPGSHLIRDHRYWSHLCMLFSGARPSEIGGLLTEHVKIVSREQGGWFEFDWTDGEGGRSLKNSSSIRVTPIHPELIKLGFLDYVDAQRAAGHRRLFPEWKPYQKRIEGHTKNEYTLSPWVKWFGRYLGDIGLKQRGLGLKGYRSAWETAHVGTDLNERTLNMMAGRAHRSESLHAYLPDKAWEHLRPTANRIQFIGLDLSHLYPK